MIGQLLLVALAGVLVAAALAPFSALSWWARQDPDDAADQADAVRARVARPRSDDDPHQAWVVYMTGVGATSGEANPRGEAPFLDDLAAALPGIGILRDVYPWDVEGRGLARDRASAWFWRLVIWLARSRWFRSAQALVYLRNVLQFAVCADDRYGPMYSIAVARQVWSQLQAAGYDPDTRRPVVLLGWSGGAQIAVACAYYLSALGMGVYVVSMGGVLTSDPGLGRVRHVWHLRGSRDHVQALGKLFPGRWPGRRGSAWARAEAEGRITIHDIGDQQHLGRGSYLSSAPSPDGRTYRQVSVDEIATRLREAVALEGSSPR